MDGSKTIDQRLDVGVFQTFSLEEDTKISGIPTLKTLVYSDLESFDICLGWNIIHCRTVLCCAVKC